MKPAGCFGLIAARLARLALQGVLTQLLVKNRVDTPAARTSARSLLDTPVNAPRGTDVAIVGTCASCQPMPLLISVALAALTALAISRTSFQLLLKKNKSMSDSW